MDNVTAKQLLFTMKLNASNDAEKEAYDKGIKALECGECEDTVDRVVVLNEIADYQKDKDYTTDELIKNINDIPRAHPVRPHGRWVDVKEDESRGMHTYYCSTCNRLLSGHIDEYMSYCPECGSRNLGGDEDGSTLQDAVKGLSIGYDFMRQKRI